MGINFSRLLSLKYGNAVASYLGTKYQSISVGRVMTCVLGMVVRREREIRSFVKTPFYRVIAGLSFNGRNFEGEWRAVKGSRYFNSPLLYKENGFQKKEDAQKLIDELKAQNPLIPRVLKMERKKENKNAPLLYNLAELQNDCARFFKISPDETLKVVQELYEKKLVTYPRTDARVLSSAVAKEISKNLRGLQQYNICRGLADEILQGESWKKIGSTRYTNDKQITDHYAIIPTGQGLGNLRNLSELSAKVYETIVRRFLSIFYPSAVYQKVVLVTEIGGEQFFSNFRVLVEEGYLKAMHYSFFRKKDEDEDGKKDEETTCDPAFLVALSQLKKGSELNLLGLSMKEGETSPPKRYTSGSMILAMENAGQLIEDEELREQIKGSGIGTSATRAEILKKLVFIKYLALNKKTQVITPTQLGEMIYDVVHQSIRPLLNPELTASWEKGLTYVAEGSITSEEYMGKLENFVTRHTVNVKQMRNQFQLKSSFDASAPYYKKASSTRSGAGKSTSSRSSSAKSSLNRKKTAQNT
jgi:DNA topoisomerase-3